jgi:hypothetical protein
MQAIRQIRTSLRRKLDDTAFMLCLAAFAIALAGLAGFAVVAVPQSADKIAAAASQPSVRSAVTGAHVNGAHVNGDVPVYRMPAINVSASRSAEMARIEQEERQARTSQNAASAS